MPHPGSEQGDAAKQRRETRPLEIPAEGLGRGAPPREQRADAGQEEEEQPDRNVDLVEERRADGNLVPGEVLADDREERSPQHCEAARQQDDVIEEEAGLARDHGIELGLAAQVVLAAHDQVGRDPDADHQEPHEVDADVGLRECVNGADQPAARHHRPEDAKEEGRGNQNDVPDLHHALLLLHHHRVQEGRAGQPGQQRGVLDGIPAPVPAPSEHHVRPPRSEQNADRLKQPGDHRPDPGCVDPALSGLARDQRGQRERERHGETDIAQVQHRRVDRHHGMLQQGVETLAVRHRRDLRAGHDDLEGIGVERDEAQEECLRRGHCHDHVRDHVAVPPATRVDCHERVRRGDPAPEQERSLLAAPPCGDLVEQVEIGVRSRRHVVEAEVVREDRVQEDPRSRRGHEPGTEDSALRTDFKERVAPQLAAEGGYRGVRRKEEGEEDREVAEIFH